VVGPISRHVAGIWSIWFLRSVSCVWFDERERQADPHTKSTSPELASPHSAPTFFLRNHIIRQATLNFNQVSVSLLGTSSIHY